MVPKRGLEPPRPCGHQLLKLARLPIPPLGQCEKRGQTGEFIFPLDSRIVNERASFCPSRTGLRRLYGANARSDQTKFARCAEIRRGSQSELVSVSNRIRNRIGESDDPAKHHFGRHSAVCRMPALAPSRFDEARA